MKITLSFFFLFVLTLGFSQNPDLPNDFLNKDWHKERRENLRMKLPENSVAVFFQNGKEIGKCFSFV